MAILIIWESMRGFGWLSRENFKLLRLEAVRNVAGLIAALGGDVREDAAWLLDGWASRAPFRIWWILFAMTRNRK